MSPCFTLRPKSKFTNSRTKIPNFMFTQVSCFTHSRVKKFHFKFSRQKKRAVNAFTQTSGGDPYGMFDCAMKKLFLMILLYRLFVSSVLSTKDRSSV